jgi:hypothetical protein
MIFSPDFALVNFSADQARELALVPIVVLGLMFRVRRAQFEVLDPVVPMISVLVMDALHGLQRAPDMGGHDQSIAELIATFFLHPDHRPPVIGDLMVAGEPLAGPRLFAATAFAVFHDSIISLMYVESTNKTRGEGSC